MSNISLLEQYFSTKRYICIFCTSNYSAGDYPYCLDLDNWDNWTGEERLSHVRAELEGLTGNAPLHISLTSDRTPVPARQQNQNAVCAMTVADLEAKGALKLCHEVLGHKDFDHWWFSIGFNDNRGDSEVIKLLELDEVQADLKDAAHALALRNDLPAEAIHKQLKEMQTYKV